MIIDERVPTPERRIAELERKLAAKTAECEALRKEAERYRWLLDRIGATRTGGFFIADWPSTEADLMKGSVAGHLDAAIDAAR